MSIDAYIHWILHFKKIPSQLSNIITYETSKEQKKVKPPNGCFESDETFFFKNSCAGNLQ